jgi:hypothetical protein
MNLLFRGGLRRWLFWGAALGCCWGAFGQTPPLAEAGKVAFSTNLPPLPVFQPRTELFRKILAMTPTEQEAWLTNRPAPVRSQLKAKIQEYEAMTPEAREAVLRATELHEYLVYFIKIVPADRSSQLAQVPAVYRSAISEKLKEFDVLPPELQKEVLAGKSTANYFLNPAPAWAGAVHPVHPPVPMPPMPPSPETLRYLNRLPPGQRQKMYASFQHFFDLNSDDRQKILATLPAEERGRVEKTLHDLENLPPAQRNRGLQSISMLASMTDEQRQAFFQNAALWEKLPPTERQTWRKVVAHLPPLPPPPEPFTARMVPAITTTQGGFSPITNPAN